MDAKARMLTLRLLESMEKLPELSCRLGLQDRSAFRASPAPQPPKTETNTGEMPRKN